MNTLPKRKPAVTAIRGNVQDDVVTQDDLARLSDFQAAEWMASRAMQKAALGIEARLAHGACIEPGVLEFDAEMKMARSRKGRGQTG